MHRTSRGSLRTLFNLVFSILPSGYMNTRRRPSSKASCTADHCWAKGAGDEHQRNAAGSAEHDSPVRAASNSYERALHLAKARQGADLILEPGINLQIAPLMHPSQRRRSGRGTPPVSARCRLAAGGGIGPVMRHRWAWAPKASLVSSAAAQLSAALVSA